MVVKNIILAVLGIVFLVIGLWLSLDFILQFAKFAIGLILIVIGISLLVRRW